MRKWILGLILGVVSVGALAGGGTKYLTLQDAAVAEAKKWRTTGVAKPILTDDGKVLFPYGQYMPTVTCTLIRVCDIELEEGEKTTDKPKMGDTARWIVSRFESGTGDKVVVHVSVKPTETNIETNMIIPTDRRVYHVRIVSPATEGDYVNRAGFYYPQDLVDVWKVKEDDTVKAAKKREELEIAAPAVSVDKLDFEYRIDGKAKFKPVRVFNDGEKVWIQMPDRMQQSEAPVLVLLDKSEKPVFVNYRVKDTYFIVDKLFDKAILVVGTDGDEEKITLTWKKTEPRSWFSFGSARNE